MWSGLSNAGRPSRHQRNFRPLAWTITSICAELDAAIAIAKAKGQAQAMVSAAGMKAKLTGLMVEKQELRVTDGDFNETMTSREILQNVAAKPVCKRRGIWQRLLVSIRRNMGSSMVNLQLV